MPKLFFTSGGARDLSKLTESQRQRERTIKGLNFFERTEQALLRALQRPEFNIHGLRRADLKPWVPLSDSALSRQLHRLRSLGLIKRTPHFYPDSSTRTFKLCLRISPGRFGDAGSAFALWFRCAMVSHHLDATITMPLQYVDPRTSLWGLRTCRSNDSILCKGGLGHMRSPAAAGQCGLS